MQCNELVAYLSAEFQTASFSRNIPGSSFPAYETIFMQRNSDGTEGGMIPSASDPLLEQSDWYHITEMISAGLLDL